MKPKPAGIASYRGAGVTRCWGQVLRFAPTLSFRGNRLSLHYSRVSQVFERQNARPDPEDLTRRVSGHAKSTPLPFELALRRHRDLFLAKQKKRFYEN